MRGAHSDVWCSKGTSLMEAELFAAERRRPAPSGRALSCAAVYAREIQGITATYKLKNARNRAPVSPVSPRDQRESRRKGGFGGVKRGQGNHMVPLPPFAPRRGHGVPRPPKAAIVHALRGRKVASSGCAAVSAQGLPSADGKKTKRRKGLPSAEGYKAKRLPNGSLKSPPGGSAGTAAH